MGGKLSRRKKGCMGDSKDEKGEQISETSTIEQKDNETEADSEETNAGIVNKEQQGSDPMQCEEQSKNEPQVDETVHQEHKSTVESNKDQTKEIPIAQKREDIETVQIKKEGNEIQKVAEVTAEQTCEAATGKPKSEGKCAPVEELPAKQPEEKHEINPSKDLKTCSPTEENKTSVSSDGTLENIPKKPAVNENSNDRNKTEEQVSSPTENASTIQSTENKKSDGDPLSGRQLNSSNDAHSVSHIDTVAQIHSLNDSKNIVNHANEATINNSDNLELVPQLQDESDNCGVLNLAQDIKTEEKASPMSECVRDDEECILLPDTSTTAVEDSIMPLVSQKASTDQTSCMPLTEPDTEQESSPALENSRAPTNMETEIENEVTGDDAVVGISTGTDCSLVQNEVALEAQQKDTVILERLDATFEKGTTVAESITERESPPPAEEVVSPLEVVDCPAPEEGYSSDLESSVASSQETSRDKQPNQPTLAVLASAAEPEACEASTEVKCMPESEESTETTSQVEPAQCKSPKLEALPTELAGSRDQTEVARRAEIEEDLSRIEMLPPAEQEEGVAPEKLASPTELKESEAWGETASPDEMETCVSPADVDHPAKLEGSILQTQVASQDELGNSAAQSKVDFPSDPEECMSQKSTLLETNIEISAPPEDIEWLAEPHTSATSSEQDKCVATVTSEPAKLAESVISEESSSSNPDGSEEATELAILSESDANIAQEKQVEGQMSAEENTLPESSCMVEPESKACPVPAQEKNSLSESISLKEAENHNESNGQLSPAHVICEKLSPKSESVSNEVISNGDLEIKGEYENPIASNGSSDLLSE